MKQTSKTLFPWAQKVDLSDKEERRTYRFSGGEFVVIDSPQFLIVSDNGHRLLDGHGTSHYVPYGWIELTWTNKGERSFYCLGVKGAENG